MGAQAPCDRADSTLRSFQGQNADLDGTQVGTFWTEPTVLYDPSQSSEPEPRKKIVTHKRKVIKKVSAEEANGHSIDSAEGHHGTASSTELVGSAKRQSSFKGKRTSSIGMKDANQHLDGDNREADLTNPAVTSPSDGVGSEEESEELDFDDEGDHLGMLFQPTS